MLHLDFYSAIVYLQNKKYKEVVRMLGQTIMQEKCSGGHALDGTEDLQEMLDGSVVAVCPVCVELDQRQDNVDMSRCASDYYASVMYE